MISRRRRRQSKPLKKTLCCCVLLLSSQRYFVTSFSLGVNRQQGSGADNELQLQEFLRTSGFAEDANKRPSEPEQVVVLTDWLDEDDADSQELPSSSSALGFARYQDENDLADVPQKFKRMVKDMWEELTSEGELDYLSEAEQALIKKALAVITAFSSLNEHPAYTYGTSRNPFQAYQEADANGDGDLTFEEFDRWYRASLLRREEEGEEDGAAAAAARGGLGARGGATAAELLARGAGLREVLAAPGGGLPGPAAVGALTGEALREAWLAADRRVPGGGGGGGGGGGNGGGGGAARLGAALAQAVGAARVLAAARADAETLCAALLAAVADEAAAAAALGGGGGGGPGGGGGGGGGGEEEGALVLAMAAQFGPGVRGILEDRARVERLAALGGPALEPTTDRPRRPSLDLDDPAAARLRARLAAAGAGGVRDPRAFLVQLAALTAELRRPPPPRARGQAARTAALARRQQRALQALQLHLPLAHALGLGARFQELEELSYKAIFPESYAQISHWHSKLDVQGQILIATARKKIEDAIARRPGLRRRIRGVEIQGRTKGMVSVFKKVFRKNKTRNQVLDLVGLRVIVTPTAAGSEGVGEEDEEHGEEDWRLFAGPPPPLALAPAAAADHEGAPRRRRRRRRGEGGWEVEEVEEVAVVVPQEEGAAAAAAPPLTERVAGLAGGGGDAAAVAGLAGGGGDAAAAAAAGAGGFPPRPAAAAHTLGTYPPPLWHPESALLHGVYEAVRGVWPERPGRYKNYVDFPKKNGYRSIHTTLVAGGGLHFEVQLRSRAMHEEAEDTHQLYKGELHGGGDEAAAYRAQARALPPAVRAAAAAAAAKPPPPPPPTPPSAADAEVADAKEGAPEGLGGDGEGAGGGRGPWPCRRRCCGAGAAPGGGEG